MITMKQASDLSKETIENYIATCQCESTEDVSKVLHMLIGKAINTNIAFSGKERGLIEVQEIIDLMHSPDINPRYTVIRVQ